MEPVTWNRKYWDIINNLYWSPKYLGLKSISPKKWKKEGDSISILVKDIANINAPLYSRSINSKEIFTHLATQEEILNHLFNLTFAIAGDEIISRLFCKPLGINDPGPFSSLGQEISSRYGWGPNKNVTQQDGLFVSKSSAIGIELKLDTSSSPEQIAKYLALMALEEKTSCNKDDLGLMFIIPDGSVADLRRKTGVSGSKITADFLRLIDHAKFNSTLKKIYEEQKKQIASVSERIRINIATWTEFRNSIAAIERELDCSKPGDQTLYRLLSGFRAQLEAHENTGIEPRP